MKRKQLPRAIRRSDDDLRAIAAVAEEEAAVRQPMASPDNVSAIDAAAFERPVANDQLPTVSIYVDGYAARRRAQARSIVERHKTFAAVGGLFPIPIVNVAGVTAVILRMVKQLSDLYGVPFERDRTRSFIVGLVGGAVPTGLGAATTSTLAFVLPAHALVGLGVSAISAGALTRGIGLVFVDHFESTSMPLGGAEIEHA
jgi:uncharacterized protein (DUF697 family)